jgi:hypothetical protein
MSKIAKLVAAAALAGALTGLTATSAQASDYQQLSTPCATTKRVAFEQFAGGANSYLYPCDVRKFYAGQVQKRFYVESGYDIKLYSPGGTYYGIYRDTGWHLLPWYMNDIGEQGTAYQRGNGYFG